MDTPPVLICCTDLIFSTKITGTAKALNRPFAVARSLEKLQTLLTAQPAPQLLILDLNITALDPIAAINLVKAQPHPPKIVAFLSHVQTELAAAAHQAGADDIMPRSKFVTILPGLLGA